MDKAHPWHGIEIGENAPGEVTVFVEIVPRDTVKYEVEISEDRPPAAILERRACELRLHSPYVLLDPDRGPRPK